MAFQFPWTNFHELNLDWFLSKFKQFANNYLETTATVELIPTNEQPEVTVTGGTLDDDTDIVDPFSFNFKLPVTQLVGAVDSVNGQTGTVVLDKDDIGLSNVDNVQQYSASNPPPYPVTSVNGQTGTVVLDKDDIGLSNVANVAQYSASNPPPYPVTSVNGQTGNVTVSPATDAQVTTAVNTWLGANVAQETGYVLDRTLSMSNAAAPADLVGDLESSFLQTIVDFSYTETSGFYGNNGTVQPASSNQEVYTGKFAVSPGQKVYWRFVEGVTKSLWVACCYYTESQTFIERVVLFPASNASEASGTLTVPDGVKYVAFTYRTYGVQNGFTAFKYHPYLDLWENIKDVEKIHTHDTSANLAQIGLLEWEKRNSGSFTNTEDSITVTTGNTYPFYVYARVNVEDYTNITVYFKGYEGTGVGAVRLGLTNTSSGTEWTWIGYTKTNYTIIDTTNYDYLVIALYADTGTTTAGKYITYYDLMVYPGVSIKPYDRVDTATDIESRGLIGFEKNKSKNPDFISILHRGGYYKGASTENRIEGIEYNCKIGGIDAVEIDVQFTSDNIPVMCHLDINPSTDGFFKDENGNPVSVTISENTFNELQQYTYIDTKVAKFEDGIKVCKKYGVRIAIDKVFYFNETQMGIIQSLLQKCAMENNVYWICPTNTGNGILAWNNKAKLIYSLSVTDWLNDNSWTENLTAYPNAEFLALFDTSNVSDANIDSIIAKKPVFMKIGLYTVNDYATYVKRFYQTDFIISNFYKSYDILTGLEH